MADLSPLLNELIEGYRNVQSSRYAHLAAGSIIIYDQFITLDQEINLIWLEPLSIGKVLFLISRYYAIAVTMFDFYAFFPGVITDTVSKHFYRWQGWSSTIVSVLTETTLQLRIYALYPDNKVVLGIMFMFFLASTGTATSIMIRAVSKLEGFVLPIPSAGRFCVPTSIASWYYTYFIPILAFESLLCALAVFKAVQMRGTGPLSVFASGRQFIHILFRDSVIYFFAIAATYLTSMLVWLLGNIELSEIPVGFSIAFPIVISNRLILNIRGMKYNLSHGEGAQFKDVNYLSEPGSQVIHVTRTVDNYLG